MKIFGRILQILGAIAALAMAYFVLGPAGGITEISGAVSGNDWVSVLDVVLIFLLAELLPILLLLIGGLTVRSAKNKQQNEQMRRQLEAMQRERMQSASPVPVQPAQETPVQTVVQTAVTARKVVDVPDFLAEEPESRGEAPIPPEEAPVSEKELERELAKQARKEKTSAAVHAFSEKAKGFADTVKNAGSTTGTSGYGVIAGVILLINALSLLLRIGSSFRAGFWGGLLVLLYLVFYSVAGVELLRKKTDGLFVAALGGVSVLEFLSFVTGFFGKRYYVYQWSWRDNVDYRFEFLTVLPYLAAAAAAAGLFALALIHGTELAPQHREKTRKQWYVPAVCAYAGGVLWILYLAMQGLGMIEWTPMVNVLSAFLSEAFLGTGFLFAGMWITYPDGLPRQEARTEDLCDQDDLPAAAYCGLFEHMMLLLLTFGIWPLIWIYRTTRNLNSVEGESVRSPVKKLLLCMFVPFYLPYWMYQSAIRADKLAKRRGMEDDISVWCLITAFLMPLIPYILIQNRMNEILKREPAAAAGAVSDASQLRTFKKLLDDGVITEEDYEAKKRQILGI